MGERHYTIAEIAKKVDVEPHLLRYWEEELALDIPRNERGLRYYRRQELMLFRSIQNLRTKGFRMSAIKMVLQDIYRVEELPAEKLLELRDRIDDAMGLKRLDAAFDGGRESVRTAFDGGQERERATSDGGSEREHTAIDGGNERVPLEGVRERVALRREPAGSTELVDKPAEKMEQFRKLMTDIVYDAMKLNSEELSRRINYTVTDSVVREMDHLMRRREEREEAHYRKLDQALAGYRREMLGEVAATKAPSPAEVESKPKRALGLFKRTVG